MECSQKFHLSIWNCCPEGKLERPYERFDIRPCVTWGKGRAGTYTEAFWDYAEAYAARLEMGKSPEDFEDDRISPVFWTVYGYRDQEWQALHDCDIIEAVERLTYLNQTAV